MANTVLEIKNEGKPVLWVVIPCYNEEDVLPITAPMFLDELEKLIDSSKVSENSRILFVNDGSTDSTWKIIMKLADENKHYIGISQSRNRGHQNAVLAGLMEAREHCDITISIDCDGQDDVSAMDEMVDKYLDGAEIVYGVRSSRKSDSFFKRFTAQHYYKILKKLGGDVVYNHADYRLMSARVLNAFADYQEVNLFLRGMVPLVGFKNEQVYYERNERIAGESHYPLSKMLTLAFDGITSLSIKPIYFILIIGIVLIMAGLISCICSLVIAVSGKSIAGWLSTVSLICLLYGIQLLSLGVVGIYIGKTYLEAKHRPRFIISEKTWEPYERHYKG